MRHRIDAGVLAILFAAAPASAQWPPNGSPLTTASTVPSTHTVTSDGSGGLVVAWSELANGQYDVYARRVTAAGVAIWTPNGVAVGASPFDQVSPALCADGNGGAIITWRDQRNGGLDIYAQRVDAHGAPLWTTNGVPVCTVTNNQYAPVLVSDGAGGAIIAWYDFRAMTYDIYAQHLDADGNALWTAGGVAIFAAQYNQYGPMIVSDGSGGAIVAWTDIRNGNADIFARRVSGAGTVQWTSTGVALCTNSGDQLDPVLVSDEAGGAVVAWRDVRNGSWDIFAQRVSGAGSVLWTANGVTLCAAPLDQLHPAIACDGAGGAVVAWDDARGPSVDVYAQRVNAAGAPLWAANGVAVCAAVSSQTRPSLVCDGTANIVVVWEDQRAGNTDIYAQRLDANGAPSWTSGGVALCDATGEQTIPLAVADGFAGAVTAWKDSRNGNADIYAHRIAAGGGTPTAVGGPANAPGLIVSSAYPNPFARTVHFDIEARGTAVALEVFDVAGRRVARRDVRETGFSFDGRDDRGRPLAGGVYFCRFTANGATVTRKIVVAR